MLLEELAKDMVEVTSALIGGRTINIMNTDGMIIASSEHDRIGSYHQGAREAMRTGKVVNIRKDQLDRYPGAKEGCNIPLRVNGAIIGVVGIFGEPDEIRDVAHLLEVYATKYGHHHHRNPLRRLPVCLILHNRFTAAAIRFGGLLQQSLSPAKKGAFLCL